MGFWSALSISLSLLMLCSSYRVFYLKIEKLLVFKQVLDLLTWDMIALSKILQITNHFEIKIF